MGTQYNGVASRIVVPATLTITSMTGSGTNPTLVTTTTPHGLSTGDTVRIINADGNTATNGTWPVTVTSGTQVSIPVTGNGTYTAAIPASLIPLTFGSTYQIPSDGDLVSASNANAAPESLGDRSAFLLGATGQYKLAAISVIGADIQGFPGGWHIAVTTSGYTAANLPIRTIGGLQVNDFVQMVWTTSADMTALVSGDLVWMTLGHSQYAPGATPPGPTRIPNMQVPFSQIPGSLNITGMTVQGGFGMSLSGSVDIWPMAEYIHFGGGTATINLSSAWAFTAHIWRLTGANQ